MDTKVVVVKPVGIRVEKEVEGVAMGVLVDGTPYLSQRGLATLCGVSHIAIGEISEQWGVTPEKPRIALLKRTLAEMGVVRPSAHREALVEGKTYYCYPADVCLAILRYYAVEAGVNCQPKALSKFTVLAGSKLVELIYRTVGYDPKTDRVRRFEPWHERLHLNFRSAPRGFYSIFTEVHQIIHDLIYAGVEVGPTVIVDISVGLAWGKHWEGQGLALHYGQRIHYPHRYPPSHPQSKSNPQEAWCYPNASLGAFRTWLQEEYLPQGFRKYLDGKVKRRELTADVAQAAVQAAQYLPIGMS